MQAHFLIRLLGIVLIFSPIRTFSQKSQLSPADSSFIIDLFEPRSVAELTRLKENAKTEAEKVNALLKLCASIYSDPHQIKKYQAEAYDLSTRLNLKREIGLSYLFGISLSYSNRAIDSCTTRAQKIFEETGDTDLFLLTNLYAASVLYRYSPHYVEPFRLLEQFISGYHIKGDPLSLAKAYNIKGEIFRTLENYPEAIKNYNIASKYAYHNGQLLYPSPLINIGTVYMATKNYDSALLFYDKVSVEYYKYKTSTHAYLANRKAQVYLLQKEYQQAIALANRSLKLYDSISYGDGIVLANSNLTSIYYNMRQYDNCTRQGERTYNAAFKDNYFPHEVQEAMRLTALAYHAKNNFAKAYQFQQFYIENYQKFFGQKVNLDLFNEQMRLNNENQQMERAFLLEKQKQTEELVLSHRMFNIIFIAALAISVAGALILFRKNKTIEKLNRELLNHEKEILAQAEELKATNEEIEAINSNLERLVAERSERLLDQNQKLTDYAYFNAHKVRGPLARILGLINVFEKELAQHTLHEYSTMLKQAGQELDKSINEINRILEKDNS